MIFYGILQYFDWLLFFWDNDNKILTKTDAKSRGSISRSRSNNFIENSFDVLDNLDEIQANSNSNNIDTEAKINEIQFEDADIADILDVKGFSWAFYTTTKICAHRK